MPIPAESACLWGGANQGSLWWGVPGGMGRLVGSSGAHLNGVSCASKEDGVLELALACVRPPSLKEG